MLSEEADYTRTEETPVEPPFIQPEAPRAERRHLTVMFCDLVGSTLLSEQLDPEQLHEMLRDYQAVCAGMVDRYEGHIAQYLGDGILVYFGYPRAHEDDARRAVSSGLGIIGAIGQLNKRLERDKGVRLKVRVVVHTGLVVVGDVGEGGRLEQLALGEIPNIAARIEGLAGPDTVVISDVTNRLIEGFFQCRNLGEYSLRGISQPVTLYQVLHESEAKSRLDVSEGTGLTPLVGRKEEVELLLSHWEGAKAGEGHMILLHGEPGIGKSRLVRWLKELVSEEPDTWMAECRCSPYYRNSALYPIIDLFERVILSFEREDSPEEKLDKLEKFLVRYGLGLEELVPLFASLLSIPTGDGYEALSLSPERKKQKILEAVLTLLLHQAEQQPVLFVIEDLHWIDPSTLELIDLIIEQEPTNRILVLLTFRPEFIPPWGVHPHLQPISLKPLGQKQTGAIVEHMAGGKKLPEEVVEQIVQKTDGVPLFVEELTKMVLESGLVREGVDRYELAGPLPPLAIPTTLHDSLIARLDKLAEVKEVAQLGSTLGREFPFVLIRAVSQLEETVLQSHLGKLVSAGLLYQRGVPPQSVYQFKHALIRDAAYESLLKSKRQRYHQQIAQVLLEKFDDVAGAQPELVAQHYTAAGLNERAVPHWQRAGEKAIERSANVEAISHLRKGLTLLKPLPETQQRTEQELDLLTALGTALMAVKGFGAQEVKQTLDRARELCGQVGETPKLFEVLHGLWIFYLTKAELKTSQEIAEQLLSLAQRFQDPASLLEAHHVLGANFFWRGKYTHAQTHLEQAITLYDSQPQSSRVLLSGREDPGLTCRSVAAQGLWLLGYPDKALKKIEMAFTQAQKLSHPFSTAYALLSAVLVHLMRGESQQAQEKAEETITLSEEQGFALWLSWTIALRGSALAKKERGEEGIAQLCQGLEACQAIGSILNQIHLRILLAEAYGKTGKIEEGLTELDKARTLVEKNEGSFYDAELYRTMGELLLVQPTPDEKSAENEFRKAIDVAQRQQSKSLELRAAVSLSRLLQKQRKGEEARKLLSEVYGWFSEGFDTVDLIEAEELLQELL